MMDKARFVATAPRYYALAVVNYFLRRPLVVVPVSAIVQAYAARDVDNPDDSHLYVPHSPLLNRAIEWLSERGLIDISTDEFAPSLLSRASDYSAKWDILVEGPEGDIFSEFDNVSRSEGGQEGWLLATLEKVNKMYVSLNIQVTDFDQPDREWEPIPLDRSEPQLNVAIQAIDQVIESVRTDNGYAATVPEERAFVLDGLSVLSTRLKTSESVSVPFIQTYGIDPFTKLLRRFGGTAIELLVATAKEALKEWLKKKGIGFLDWL